MARVFWRCLPQLQSWLQTTLEPSTSHTKIFPHNWKLNEKKTTILFTSFREIKAFNKNNLWWFHCPQATSAPALDLELIENLKNYICVDKEVASSALKAFKRHTWYLHAEVVPLALWGNISPERKQKLADQIIKQQRNNDRNEEFVGRIGSGYGKPDLLTVNIEANWS